MTPADVELKPGESLVAIYVRVRPIDNGRSWAAVLVATGQEHFGPTRATALATAIRKAATECT